MAKKMKIGEVFRYGRPYKHEPETKDDFPNFFHYTYTPDQNLCLLESGINPIAEMNTNPGKRRPAVLISSSPHKIGSHDTPWHDYFNPDHGHIRYYGDNKIPGNKPENAPGNKVLLKLFEKHSSLDPKVRATAVPLIFFKRVPMNGKSKGYVQFQGFGIIQSIQLVTQFDRKNNRTFTNYEFDFAVFGIDKENEEFNWNWISDRRTVKDHNYDQLAPASWKAWVKDGEKSINKIIRRVSKLLVSSTEEQKTKSGSIEDKSLRKIYDFYNTPARKKRFEALASKITASIVNRSARNYREGWITQGSSDGGADFIGRLDVGEGFSTVKLIVLGQAKCEKINTPTGGNHIARTVARLKRGWVGAYVTTSYFSEPVQREVYEDEYPLILINGLQLAKEALRIVSEEGFNDIDDLLQFIDNKYDTMIKQRKPEEILLD